MEFAYLVISRFLLSAYYNKVVNFDITKKRTKAIVIGAGAAGQTLFNECEHNNDSKYEVVAFVDDDPQKIVQAIRISRKCIRIVYENIYFAIGIKFACLILGATGVANMWLAIFADVGVMVLAVLNAIRALYAT